MDPSNPLSSKASKDETLFPQTRHLAIVAIICISAILVSVATWLMMRRPEAMVETIRPQSIEISLAVVGTARPKQLVDVRSPNAGRILDLFYDDGELVAEGEPLGVIQAVVEQAQSDAVAARERAAAAEASRVRLIYERTENLAARGFAAEAALDEARAALEAANAELAAASAERRAAIARAGEFIVRAPMSGVVLLRPIDNGQVVSSDTTLFKLGSVEGGELYADVDEIYADALKTGMMARAALSGSKAQFSARITEVSPQVDPSTGGRLIKLAPMATIDIPPGRSVDITIVLAVRENSIIVPRQAVIDVTSAPRVYVVDSKGLVRVREVEVDPWPSIDAIILAGLRGGDLVVLDPGQTKPGARVRVLERRADSNLPKGF